MKSTGMVRKLDELGRVVIPIEIRNKLRMVEKDPIEIYIVGNTIMLKKVEESCILCGKSQNLIGFKDKLVCKKCADEVEQKMKLANK